MIKLAAAVLMSRSNKAKTGRRVADIARLFLSGTALCWPIQLEAQVAPAAATSSNPAVQPITSSGPAAGNGLSEIIVTANRRAENLQKSSLAIQAFDSGAIRAVGVTQAVDLNKIAPDLQIATDGPSTQIYIRGVGDFSGSPLSNPGIAFNVDGVYVGRADAVNPNFYDISRLEVLKGPQGTLYGRNATGGAINLITNSPSLDKFSGYVNAEVGNYNYYRIEAAVNVPLSDTLAVRGALNGVTRSGYLSDGTNDDKEQEARLKILWKPTDLTSLLINVDGGHQGGKGGGYVYLPRAPGADAWDAVSAPINNAYLASIKPLGPLLTPQGTDSFLQAHYANVSAQLDQNLGFATLTIIPAFRWSDVVSQSYKDQRQHVSEIDHQYTTEARLGHSSSKLKWVAGFFYYHDHDPGETQVLVSPAILNSEIVYGPHDRSYAFFGESTYSITDRFRLIAGGRYTSETKDLSGQYYDVPLNGVKTLLEDFGGHLSFTNTTWKAGAEFDIARESLLYFTASTGFKAGGINQTEAPDNTYKPEKIMAYELGSRNRFFDNKLQLNVEGFYWKYRNQQNTHITFDNAGNLGFLTEDAGKAYVYGVNVDITAKLSSRDTIHVVYEYDHSKYNSFVYDLPTRFYNPIATSCKAGAQIPGPFQPLTPIDCSGFPLPHDPSETAMIDYDHTFPLASGAAFDLDLGAHYASRTYLAVDFSPQERAPSYVIANASLSYHPPQRNWSLTAFVRNINNGKDYTGGQESQQVPQLFSATIAPPRTFGVQAGVKF